MDIENRTNIILIVYVFKGFECEVNIYPFIPIPSTRNDRKVAHMKTLVSCYYGFKAQLNCTLVIVVLVEEFGKLT